jgi:hypothetical protein
VWPAFWTLDSVKGDDSGGEIDIVRGAPLPLARAALD